MEVGGGGREEGEWGNFLFRRGRWVEVFGKTATNRYFCVSKLRQSPTETKPEEKMHKLTKWSISEAGGAAVAVVVAVEEEVVEVVDEEQGRALKTGEALFG